MNNLKEHAAMSEIEIQTLLPSQWQEYKEIRLRSLIAEPQAFLSRYEESASFPDEKWQQRLEAVGKGRSWTFFARSENGNLVGIVGGYRDDNDMQNHSVQIWGLYVDPVVRGKGIGRDLMEKVLEEVEKESDIQTVVLEVSTNMDPAKRLYESLGFEGKETYPMTLGDGKEYKIVKMEKHLNK